MVILALETATPVCSVALFYEGRTTVHLSLHRPRAHAAHLVPMMADALRYGQVRASDVTAVAVSSGPGSYTGLRIGVSSAKGIASAVGADLVAVPSLLALADGVRPAAARGDLIAAAFDARRDEAYAALYRVAEGGELEPERDTTVIRAEDAAEWLQASGGGALFLVGGGWRKMQLEGVPHRFVPDVRPSAVPVARIAARKLDRGEIEDVVSFEPYYLKEFVATKPKSTVFEKLQF